MKTVKVRIACAVDSDGRWNATGWCYDKTKLPSAKDVMDLAVDPLGDVVARYWIEAELQVPEVETIQADVEQVQ